MYSFDLGLMLPSAFHVLVLSLIIAFLYRPLHSGNVFETKNSDASDLDTPNFENILLVTAHPDDECLFFAPTVLALRRYRDTDNELFSLCLSSGNANGMGHIRRKEYEKSLDVLGIKNGNRIVLDDPYLQDSRDPSNPWEPLYIADIVEEFVVLHNITTILTFDRSGVSYHPNHEAIPRGIQRMLSRPFSPDSASHSYPPQPKLYMLITVPLSIKYVSILAPLVAKFDLNSMKFLHYFEDRLAEMGFLEYVDRFRFAGTSSSFSASAEEGGRVGNRGNPMPVFVAGIYDYLTALRAMREHWSQLVWFRWLNVLFSRYMWVNEWAEVSLRMEPVQGTADENAAV